VHAQWWNIPIPSTAMNDMKAAKYTGNYADLNIYTTMMQDNLLGCGTPAQFKGQVRFGICIGVGVAIRANKCATHGVGLGSRAPDMSADTTRRSRQADHKAAWPRRPSADARRSCLGADRLTGRAATACCTHAHMQR
jgi:hypothetical protein